MSAPFVSSLGVRPDMLRLAPPVAQGAPHSAWTIRVHGAEVWDAIRVEVLPSARLRDVKTAALARLMPDADDVTAFVVKLAGVELSQEDASLTESGVCNGSTLLLMLRRRRAVR